MTSQAHTPGPAPPSCPPNAPSLLLPAFPGAALLVTSSDAPGSKLIIKLKREGPMVGGAEEMPRMQTFFLTGMPLGWAAPRRDGPAGPCVRTVLLTKAGDEPVSRKLRMPETVPAARAPPPGDASFACTSKGVYENYRRWQRYKALARRHFPATPDAEALACFFIPVLRSLARLRPDMTLEDGVPRAVQEWEHSSNFERMIFYEMAEKFMEFEAEEEQQIQKMKLLASCSQFQAPAPKATKPPASPVPESGQQQVYIPKKSASKSRQPRRRQRRPPSTSAPGAPREIPAEAVHQYAEIMEGLDTSWEEEEDEKKEQGECGVPQDQEDRVFPDPSLLPYIDQLCEDEEFVCKVEAIIHPQFMADLLSPEKSQDPLDLVEELVEELNLTPSQLIEKRLLALSEEEREPSVCPTSHSDSTPSQSEEEDEVIGNGKGEDVSCQAMKRPSPNKGIRSNQVELPTQFPLAPHLHQRWRERHLPPKGVRPAASLFPHKCSSHDPQEGRMLPSLKNKDEAESQNSQGQDKAGGHLGQLSGDPPHAQRLRLEATTSVTGENSLNGNLTSQGDLKAGPEFQKPHTTKYSKEADNQEGNVKGQLEVPRTTEQDSRAVKAQFQNGSQIVWKSLESALSSCGKQGGVQQWRVKCLKKVQVMGEGPGEDPRWTDHASQDTNYMLLADTVTQEGTLKLTMNRQEGQNTDCAEKATSQSLDQGSKGPEGTSGSIQLGSQSRGMTRQWDNLLKQVGQGLTQPECNKHDGCPRVKDPNPWKGPNSATGTTETQFGSTSLCGQSLQRQGSPALVPSEPRKQFDGRETKAQPQIKTPIGWEPTKATVVTANSPVRSVRLFEDRLALPKQSTSARQDGQRPLVLEVDRDVNYPILKPHVEPSCDNGQQLADSSSVGVLESQLPSIASEHPPYFTCVVLEPSSLSTQKGPGRSQESERPLAEQGEVTPWLGSSSAGKQTLKPTLNPPGYANTFETEGGSWGPSGDHMPEPTSPGKAVATLPTQPSTQGCCSSSSHENSESKQWLESSDPPPSEVHSGASSSKSGVKSLSKVEEGGLLEAVAKTSILLPELPGGSPKDGGKYGPQDKADEEEDEELTTFSSLLASKLSLSPHSGRIPPPREPRDTLLSLLTETGKQGAKTRHSPRGQVFQDSIVLLSKNVDANQTVYRSHKRKGSSSGTRRSKRLRNQ